MIALLDIGNTRTKFCVAHHGKRNRTNRVLNEQLNNDFLEINFSDVTKIVIASVSTTNISSAIELWCIEKNIAYQRVRSEKTKKNITNAYQEFEKLGVDRWLTLIATAELYPERNVLIIDAGTATTVDLLASNGQHQGGWILAGVDMLVNSLVDNTAQLKVKNEEKISLAFGQNTSENIHNGAWVATVAAVNMAIAQSERNGFMLDKIILTGGNAKILAPLLAVENIVIEDLIFAGLQTYI
ncbi:MAG: type III pantothenate kinase [Litorilituus sp.]|jgi:type III pantothenate kinase|nr:type III pantothenate kinase [Litorilituus sp.]